tara:strand:- start:1022 stop:1294 length:273 start_codon:yes stop_codon:yes gene_type:complete
VSETINISGDTFEVSYEGECSVGGWKIADAPNQHIAVVPQSVGEDKIKEVMNDRYQSYEWGYYYTKLYKSYCIVLRSDPVEDFIKVLNSM